MTKEAELTNVNPQVIYNIQNTGFPLLLFSIEQFECKIMPNYLTRCFIENFTFLDLKRSKKV